MAVLTSAQRSTLEKVVILARKQAETGGRNALQALAVNEPEPFSHQSPEQRSLRNRLRYKARLLGDILETNGIQSIDHLSYELAYEYWHKMLFAQFLESNGFLMHPDGVAVTMEECEELSREEGHANKWDTAAFYASKMLPAIFRIEDPLMQVVYAPNDRIALESLIENMDHHIFTADDALGWVYQFWQSEAKDIINKSEDKIDGARLPAVTQLFTEPYMVHFLIDNTLGAWWVSRNPGIIPPIKFEYLRMIPAVTEPVKGPSQSRTLEVPAAGKFEGWPDKTAKVTTLDPCMGSGHFVSALFTVFVLLRMFEEGLTKEEATDKVISENLHGLELDPRCTQIAAFNLALTAWKFCGHFKVLPEMNLACSGIAPKGKKEDWVKLVRNETDPLQKERLQKGMSELFDHFQLAPELGSLLDPSTIVQDAFTAGIEELQPTLKKALVNEIDKDQLEWGVMAAGIAKAGVLLSRKYQWIITNVPYLGSRKQATLIKEYLQLNYPNSKHDIGISFFEKFLKYLLPNGTISLVTQRAWSYKDYFKKFRKEILITKQINYFSILGVGAFQTISGEVVDVILTSVSNKKPIDQFFAIDLEDINITKEKGLLVQNIKFINQGQQLINPDYRISVHLLNANTMLEQFGLIPQGIKTGDDNKFIRCYWEMQETQNNGWVFCQTGFEKTIEFTGLNNIINWSNHGIDMIRPRLDSVAINRKGIGISQTGDTRVTLFLGSLFDSNVAPFIPYNLEYLSAIWCYCKSEQYKENIKKVDPGLFKTNSVLLKVPFNLEYWQKIASENYPSGLPKPYSNDPTQWLFHGHVYISETPLQVAIARFLGFRWPAESDIEMELSEEVRQLITEIQAFDHLTDDDGILCIPSVNGETSAPEALRSYLQTISGNEWNNQTIEKLLQKEGSTKSNLEEWLREEFYVQHCKLFQNRPFIWHIWDGRKDGFGALVNYHKLTKENLQKLIYTYLGDWIRQCENRLKNGESGADGQLSAARKLKEKLELILEGESPYDIFVRWKKLEEQPIGWEPDLNDGVRLNIRPFITADVLRKKPNIKWGIDRGKNPPDSPWGEIRDNDNHLTLEEKRKARENNK